MAKGFKWSNAKFIAYVDRQTRSFIEELGHRYLALMKMLFHMQKTGRTYMVNGVPHVASAPGEAPGIVTGLLSTLRMEIKKSRRVGWYIKIFTGADYAPYLEYGTDTMDPRPSWNVALAMLTGEIRMIGRRTF